MKCKVGELELIEGLNYWNHYGNQSPLDKT